MVETGKSLFQMQDQFGNDFEEWELKQPQICEGTDEYKNNIKFLKTTIAKLKTPEGAKEMQVRISHSGI